MIDRQKIQVLIIEDHPADQAILLDALSQQTDSEFELFSAERLSCGIEALENQPMDLVILDLGLPDSQGIQTFTDLQKRFPNVPVLVLTGLNDENTGIEAMQHGAQDYLVKNQIQPLLLGRTVRYAIERQRYAIELKKSENRLRLLAARLNSVREQERTLISREIHDQLGQLLTGFKMDLRWIERRLKTPPSEADLNQVREKVVVAEDLIDKAIESVQRIAIELRPAVLDHLGITEAIRDESRRFEGRTGTPVHLDLNELVYPPSGDTATACFRIFQELLTNVARHSGASRVEVDLTIEDDNLLLTVIDNGRGFSTTLIDQSTSLGLLGMSERASILRGQIDIYTAPGKGTRTVTRIPMKATIQ